MYRDRSVQIKRLKPLDESNPKFKTKIDEFKREMEITEKCQHPFISEFIGTVIIPGKLTIVTETSEYLSIYDLIKKEKDPLPLKLRIKFCHDASLAIKYLHKNGVMHRNIKPAHFLVTSLDKDESINVKISGFGTARYVDFTSINPQYTKNVGTPAYMSPEIFNHADYNIPTDIYSFAITMLEIMVWNDAFPSEKYPYAWDISDAVKSGKRPESIEQVTNHDMKQLIQMCWKQETFERLPIKDVCDQLAKIYDFQQIVSN